MTDHDLVLVVDFGAQYAQLIARRVREAKVYSEIVPHTTPVEEILAREPKAVILSGGPSSVYEPGAPVLDGRMLEGDVPVFGICYGFMAMAQALGGTVARTGQREYGRTRVEQQLAWKYSIPILLDAYETLFAGKVIRRARELDSETTAPKPDDRRSDTKDGLKLAGTVVA